MSDNIDGYGERKFERVVREDVKIAVLIGCIDGVY